MARVRDLGVGVVGMGWSFHSITDVIVEIFSQAVLCIHEYSEPVEI
jgi:hypothetical protein